MVQECKTKKKVDHKLMSGQRCKECGKPLKQNSTDKGHKFCYVCFKLSKGKTTANIYLVLNGVKTSEVIGRRNFIQEQRLNIEKYKHEIKGQKPNRFTPENVGIYGKRLGDCNPAI